MAAPAPAMPPATERWSPGNGGRRATGLPLPPESWKDVTPDPDAPPLRFAMSWDEYDTTHFPDWLRVEWADGIVFVMGGSRYSHSRAVNKLGFVLQRDLPDLDILPEPTLRLLGRERQPDLMVVDPVTVDSEFVERPPLLVAEVLSPSTWRLDLLTKANEYAEFGIPHYLLVDPEHREIHIRRNVDGAWVPAGLVGTSTPEATVEINGHGTVTLRHADIFP